MLKKLKELLDWEEVTSFLWDIRGILFLWLTTVILIFGLASIISNC